MESPTNAQDTLLGAVKQQTPKPAVQILVPEPGTLPLSGKREFADVTLGREIMLNDSMGQRSSQEGQRRVDRGESTRSDPEAETEPHPQARRRGSSCWRGKDPLPSGASQEPALPTGCGSKNPPRLPPSGSPREESLSAEDINAGWSLLFCPQVVSVSFQGLTALARAWSV